MTSLTKGMNNRTAMPALKHVVYEQLQINIILATLSRLPSRNHIMKDSTELCVSTPRPRHRGVVYSKRLCSNHYWHGLITILHILWKSQPFPLILLTAEGWTLEKQRGGKLMRRKKCGRGPGALFMCLYWATFEFKRNEIHIQFHILPGQIGNFPNKRFLNIWSHGSVRMEHWVATVQRAPFP